MNPDEYGLLTALNTHLKNRPDAIEFITAFKAYSHAIDDIIDIPERRADDEFILETFTKAQDVYSSRFYVEHVTELYSVVKVIHALYVNSVKYEKEGAEEWQKKVWEVTRNCANIMLSQVIRIVVRENTGSAVNGDRAMVDICDRATAQSWKDHHSEKGEPI